MADDNKKNLRNDPCDQSFSSLRGDERRGEMGRQVLGAQQGGSLKTCSPYSSGSRTSYEGGFQRQN